MMMVSAVGFAADMLAPEAEDDLLSGRRGCLVVSGDAVRRRRFEAAAELRGWAGCVAPENSEDLGPACESDFDLVVVDVATPFGDRVNDAVEIAEEMAAQPDTLLVVCGTPDDIDVELWARQLGAWFVPVCRDSSLSDFLSILPAANGI
jgi:hypothetical protein